MNNEVFYFVIHLFLVQYWILREDNSYIRAYLGFLPILNMREILNPQRISPLPHEPVVS